MSQGRSGKGAFGLSGVPGDEKKAPMRSSEARHFGRGGVNVMALGGEGADSTGSEGKHAEVRWEETGRGQSLRARLAPMKSADFILSALGTFWKTWLTGSYSV